MTTTPLFPNGLSMRDPKNPEHVQGQAVPGGAKPVAMLERISSPDLRASLSGEWDFWVEPAQCAYLEREAQIQSAFAQAQLRQEEGQRQLEQEKTALEQEKRARQDAAELEVSNIKNALTEKQHSAGEAWGQIGLAFDINNPRPELPFVRPEKDSDLDTARHSLIALERLKVSQPEKTLAWLFVSLTGFSTGASLYLSSGGQFGIRLDPITFVGFLAVGISVIVLFAFFAGRAGRNMGRNQGRIQGEVAPARKLAYPKHLFIFLGITLNVVLLLFMTMEAATAHEGVIAQIIKQDVSRYLDGSAPYQTNPLIFWLLAFFVSGTLTAYKVFSGFDLGHADAVYTLLKEENARVLVELRQTPERQSASTLAQQVLVYQHTLAEKNSSLDQNLSLLDDQIVSTQQRSQ